MKFILIIMLVVAPRRTTSLLLSRSPFSSLAFGLAGIHKKTTQAHNFLASVILSMGKEKFLLGGNPIVYGNTVRQVIGEPLCGDLVDIKNEAGTVLARGFYNPFSMYRIRVTTMSTEAEHALSLPDLLLTRLRQAASLRRVIGLPSKSTTAYRLINGEGDRLGGLIVDVLGDTVVVQSSALWVQRYRSILINAIRAITPNDTRVVWHTVSSRLQQDGISNTDMSLDADDGVVEERSATSQGSNTHVILENEVKFEVDTSGGQKTGFYCDQRANRLLVRGLCAGKEVLDSYCYSGGFAINAALGGATAVLALDSSSAAVDLARRNAELNGVSGVVSVEKGDATKVMSSLREQGRLFDVVICDPPKLAPNRDSVDKAKNKYKFINSLALSLVRPGGLLLTCTCSASVTQQAGLFRSIIRDSATTAGRSVQLLQTMSADCDHPEPIAFPESAYLQAMLLRVI